MCAHFIASGSATSTSTTTSTSTATPGRSLLSRLTSPLRSRTRNLTKFHIRPDEPHRQYAPGDVVKGAVVLTIVKPIRITHLTVCLHGFVRVYKQPNNGKKPPPAAEPTFTASGNPMKSQYFGNGHASLFQDEIVLCPEKRLDAGIYEFNFELDFPSKGLPTSIDFDRGTISYMITATITRPTSIAATSSCDRKLAFVETVDVGPIECPGPRTISLDPESRRPKRKKPPKRKKTSSTEANDGSAASGSEPACTTGSPAPDESASQCGSSDPARNPRSPISNDMQSTGSVANSGDSTVSSSTGVSFRLGHVSSSSARSTWNSHNASSMASLANKTITATVELLKSGFLPGDNIPVKVAIKHTKVIKSLHGIIITLFRQGRIDSAPPLSLFVDLKGKAAEKLKHEEYYPKSKTGLGGLSLTSAGSSSLFRKDLAQTFAPILVDPTTLTAVVNTSVRVPEDCFPTISGVPGEMISFKYHVEVVLDLGGKLAGQQRHVPRAGAVGFGPNGVNSETQRDGNSNILTAWGGNIVDTDHIRREKSVVQYLFDVTIGTKDSTRGRGRGQSQSSRPSERPEEIPATPTPNLTHEPIYEEPFVNGEDYRNGHASYEYTNPYYQDPYHGHYSNEGDPDNHYYEPYPPDPYAPPAHTSIPYPPPEILQDENISEKERMRHAEIRLLPSRPPLEDIGESSHTTIQPNSTNVQPALRQDGHVHQPYSTNTLPVPSAPTLEDLNPDTNAQHSDEDKQELERRRLLAEVSAPSDFPADVVGGEDVAEVVGAHGNGISGAADAGAHGTADREGRGVAEADLGPSAPVLTEEDEERGLYSYYGMPEGVGGGSWNGNGDGSGRFAGGENESLPRYER